MHILISALSRFTQPTGICRHAANLACCLSDLPQITRVTLLVGQWQEEYFRTAFDIGSSKIELVPIGIANRSLARNRWFAFELPQVAKKYDPDVVHLGFPVPIFRSRFSCPVVVTVHDLYPFDWPEDLHRFNGFCKRAFFRRCIRACDAITFVSESTQRSFEKRFPHCSQRIPEFTIPNFAELPTAPGESTLRIDPKPFLLTVAQHQPNKRLDLIIRALARIHELRTSRTDVSLVVVGSDGSQSDALHALSKALGLETHVHWLASLSDRQLAWLYANCEVFVVSSNHEGFCIPLLEATLFNRPIVASDIPVHHEVAGDAPLYFDLSGDPVENLTKVILRVFDGGIGASRTTGQFSKGHAARMYQSMYAVLLKDRPSALEPMLQKGTE